MKNFSLGDRMKEFYEDRFRYYVPRRTYTLIRIDGKAFHTYTKGLVSPFDAGLIADMNETTAYLCKNIQGANFGYCQSDEISILITDFDERDTQMWFDGNLQKMASVAASMATSKFNELRADRYIREKFNSGIETITPLWIENLKKIKKAEFDARVFQIPQKSEVENYFIFRQQDGTRNSVQSVAQSLYSQSELNGKKEKDMQEMIFQKGINWNDYHFREKRGGIIAKVPTTVEGKNGQVERLKWQMIPTPIFTQEREFMDIMIPEFGVKSSKSEEVEV
ncbi:MAG: tRNA(His) guanylyltransferase Thg1 family protein [Chlamydiia bacterium]